MANQLMEVKKGTVDVVTTKIKELENRGEIQFPPDYSPQNALRSAWLILQETVDRNKQPVLQTCTRTSIMNSLFDMTVQGLNPAKKQVYFIAYGDQLICQRSYHGTKALAMRVDPDISDIVAEVVWEGDDFEYEIVRGQKRVVRHKQTLDSIDSKNPKGAYCVILDSRGEVKRTDVMSYEQIKQAWRKSQTKPVQDNGQLKAGSTHAEFLEDMIKKTIINRACKPIINSSSDAHLYESANRSEQVQAQAEAETQAALHANQGEVVDAEFHAPEQPAPDPDVDPDTGETLEYRQEAEQAAEPEPAMSDAEPGF